MNLNVIFSESTMAELINKASETDPAFCPNGCRRSFKGYKRRSNLKSHLMYACGVDPQFKCTICQKQWRQNKSLKYHMATVHPQIVHVQ